LNSRRIYRAPQPELARTCFRAAFRNATAPQKEEDLYDGGSSGTSTGEAGSDATQKSNSSDPSLALTRNTKTPAG
jgi:hypothetical protein